MLLSGQLHIECLGGVRIRWQDQELKIRSRKALACLIYMAMEQRSSVTREALAGLIWSDAPEQNSKASLRQALMTLRQDLEQVPGVFSKDDKNALLDLSRITIDLDHFVDRLESGDLPKEQGTRSFAGAHILVGLEDISDEFQIWLQAIRSSSEVRVLEAMRKGYESPEFSDLKRLELAAAAADTDPLCEHACRTLISLHSQHGNVAAALKAYARLYEAMEHELDLEPSAQTQDLIVRVKMGQAQTASPAPARTDSIPAEARQPIAKSSTPVVAVLPPQFVGREGTNSFLPEILADDIVCRMARYDAPLVIASSCTRNLSMDISDVKRLQTQLNANYALSGTLSNRGDTWRLSTQLLSLENVVVIWAATFDLSEVDVFSAQDQIVEQISCKIVPTLEWAERRTTANVPSRALGAYHLVLRARDMMYRLDRDEFGEAENLLSIARREDPDFSMPHAAYAEWLSLKLGQGWSTDARADQDNLVKSAAEAVRLKPTNGRPLALLGHSQGVNQCRHDDAIRSFDRAISESPGDAETLMWSVPTLAYSGNSDRAIENIERAMSLTPGDPSMFRMSHFASVAQYSARDFAESATSGLASLEKNPNYTSCLRVTAAALVNCDRMAEARSLSRRVMQLEPGFRVSKFIQRQPFRDPVRRQEYGRDLVACGLPV